MFLVIVLILFGFWGILGQSSRKVTTLLRGESAQPTKPFSEYAGILQVDLHGVTFGTISFATIVSVLANAYQAVTNAAGCLITLARPIFCNFGNSEAVSEASRSRYVRNRELSRGTKSIMRNFSDTNKMHCDRNPVFIFGWITPHIGLRK